MNVQETFAQMREQTKDDQAAATLTLAAAIAEQTISLAALHETLGELQQHLTELGQMMQRSINFR